MVCRGFLFTFPEIFDMLYTYTEHELKCVAVHFNCPQGKVFL